MIEGLHFHHLGVACQNLEREAEAFRTLGYEMIGEVFTDPVQRVRGCFLRGPGPDLELLAPMDETSPLKPWLNKGVKIYHQAYEVESLKDTVRTLVENGGRIMSSPKPAEAFGGREIAFVMLPNLFLIEVIQAH
jgi:methylmalonyl-CoA/ethylmalonyl-CoA epimerase